MSQGCKFCAASLKDQFWHPDKPKNLSIMAGVEFEKYAIMANPQLKKPSSPNTNLDRLGHTGGYLQVHSLTFLHCANRTYKKKTPWLNDKCHRVASLSQPALRNNLEPAIAISKEASIRLSRQGGFQEKESSPCTMAGFELEKCTTWKEMSNQQSQKQEILCAT